MAREEQEQSALGAAHVHHHQPPAGGCGLSANPTAAAAEYAHGTYAALPPPPSLPVTYRPSSPVRDACGAAGWDVRLGGSYSAIYLYYLLFYHRYNTHPPPSCVGRRDELSRSEAL